MRVRCRSSSGLDGVSGSSGNSRKSTWDLKRMPAVSRFPTSMTGRLSKVSFTCPCAGGTAPHRAMAIADAHVNTTRVGQLFIDRAPRAALDVAQPLEHRRRTQAAYREALLM